jgi:hypothetical protein
MLAHVMQAVEARDESQYPAGIALCQTHLEAHLGRSSRRVSLRPRFGHRARMKIVTDRLGIRAFGKAFACIFHSLARVKLDRRSGPPRLASGACGAGAARLPVPRTGLPSMIDPAPSKSPAGGLGWLSGLAPMSLLPRPVVGCSVRCRSPANSAQAAVRPASARARKSGRGPAVAREARREGCPVALERGGRQGSGRRRTT